MLATLKKNKWLYLAAAAFMRLADPLLTRC